MLLEDFKILRPKLNQSFQERQNEHFLQFGEWLPPGLIPFLVPLRIVFRAMDSALNILGLLLETSMDFLPKKISWHG